MWGMRAKLMLGLCLFTLIYLTVVDCRLLEPHIKQAKRALEQQKQIPEDSEKLTKRVKESVTELKILNWEFCMDMYLRPEDHSLVLPWWYQYCQDVRKKNPKLMGNYMDIAEVDKYIQAEKDLYKERLNSKNVEFSELELNLVDRQMKLLKKK